jgi:hypothetical protein
MKSRRVKGVLFGMGFGVGRSETLQQRTVFEFRHDQTDAIPDSRDSLFPLPEIVQQPTKTTPPAT